MAWVVEADGVNDEMQSATLGNLVSSKLRVVSEHVTWSNTGYLWSQAAPSASSREFGLFIQSNNFTLYAGGATTLLASAITFPASDVTLDLTVDYVANTAILIVDGVTAFSGSVSANTSRVNGTLFRAFAREGGFFAPSGTRIGNTEIYIDDVLVRDYDFDGSSHGPGTVTVDEAGGDDWTGVNMPTDGSAWIDLGGVISITVTEVLSLFSDSSVIDIETNVSLDVTETLSPFSDSSILNITPEVSVDASVTEVLNSFSDSSIIAIVEAGNIAVSVTETFNPFNDSSVINVSANVEVNITEVLNSFLDGSNVTIAKDIVVEVTEVFASFNDNSIIKLPANWTDKPVVATSYTNKPPVNTIWTDKG